MSSNPSPIVRTWRRLSALPYANAIELRQAALVQTLLVAVLLLSSGGSFIALLAPIPLAEALAVMAIVWLGVPIAGAGLWLLRGGRLRAATLLTCLGLVLLLSFLLIATGARDGGAVLFGFALPIVLAGLLAGPRTLGLVTALSGGGILLAMVLERLRMPLVGIAAPRGENIAGILGGFLVIAAILGVFVLRFGQALRAALDEAQRRAQKLEEAQGSLERAVAARTFELRAALDDVQARAADQARLLEENRAQRSAIQALSVPVLPVSATTLVMPLVGTLDTERLLMLQERALHALERSSARRILLDLSAVPLVDTRVARGLLAVVAEARLLGAEAILVGIRPEVAEALVALDVGLVGVRTYRDLEAALLAER